MEFEYYLTDSSSSLRIQASRLEPDYYAIGFRQNLPQGDTIAASVDDVIHGPVWPTRLGRYVPAHVYHHAEVSMPDSAAPHIS